MHDRIAILDAGAQYGKLIDRAIREMCIESVLLPMNTPLTALIEDSEKSGNPYKAIVISGGPGSVYDKNASKCHSSIFAPYLAAKLSTPSLPILGICYGFQLINYTFDGVIQAANSREDGVFPVTLDINSKLYKGLEQCQNVLLTHGDSLIELGKGLKSNALSGQLVVGLEHEKYPVYGVQYHVEVTLSPCGRQILKNFCFNIAGCSPNFTLPDRELLCLTEIKEKVKEGKVLLLLSGGVDSCTCLALLKKCLRPEQIIALHINNGFLRHEESAIIEKNLPKILGVPIKVVDASNRFLQYPLPYTDFFDLTFPGVMECCLAKFINHSLVTANPASSPSKLLVNSSADQILNGYVENSLENAFKTSICCCCCACYDNKDMICQTFNKIYKMNPRGVDGNSCHGTPKSNSSDDGKIPDTEIIEIKHCDCCCTHQRSPSPEAKTNTSSHDITHHEKRSVNAEDTNKRCHCCAPNMAQLVKSSSGGLTITQIGSEPPTLKLPLRSIEEALIKMGFGPHCFKNYDGNIMLKPLCKILNPEIKRRIIGDIFVQVADEAISELKLNPQNVYFCQGTLRPDLIESASHLVSHKADVIKTHHNDTKLMRMLRAQGKVIEPLKDFHKDEVRCLARGLQLPTEIVERHPFPGPGLAIRIICAVEPYMDKNFTETNFILRLLVQVIPEEYPKICHSNAIVQRLKETLTSMDKETLTQIVKNDKGITYSAILLPIKSVGVQGDKRSYSYVCALSCTIPALLREKYPQFLDATSPAFHVDHNFSNNSRTSLNARTSFGSLNSNTAAGKDVNSANVMPFLDNSVIIPPAAYVPWDELKTLATIIPKVCHNVNRVVFVFGPEYRHPITDIVPTFINPLILAMVRKADHLAHSVLLPKASAKSISQMPVVLLPIQFDRTFDSYLSEGDRNLSSTPTANTAGGAAAPPSMETCPPTPPPPNFMAGVHHTPSNATLNSANSLTNTANITIPPYVTDDPVLRSVVLRPFISSDFMTGLAAIPGVHLDYQILDEMVEKLTHKIEGVSRVLYDLTNKPPGTTEWE